MVGIFCPTPYSLTGEVCYTLSMRAGTTGPEGKEMQDITWGAWFGTFATAAAAKRYLTINYTGPKVDDRSHWVGDVRQSTEGTWEVRLGELPVAPTPQVGW